MRVNSSRISALSDLEHSQQIINSWTLALPSAQSITKASLGLGLSFLTSRLLNARSKGDKQGKLLPSLKYSLLTGLSRYLVLHTCSTLLFPFVNRYLSEGGYTDLSKTLSKNNLDSVFYRWLGLEN